MNAPAEEKSAFKIIASNRKASHDYHIVEKFEAGIELKGAEVKSIREGRVSLGEAYASIENGQIVLYHLHVLPYVHSRIAEHDPIRPKRLLMHKDQIHRLVGQTAVKGFTVIPLKVYLKKGWVKIELGLAKGKLAEDKRESIKRKTADREVQRIISSRVKGR